VTGVLHTARISTVKVIMSSDMWMEMANFKIGNQMWQVNWSTWHEHGTKKNSESPTGIDRAKNTCSCCKGWTCVLKQVKHSTSQIYVDTIHSNSILFFNENQQPSFEASVQVSSIEIGVLRYSKNSEKGFLENSLIPEFGTAMNNIMFLLAWIFHASVRTTKVSELEFKSCIAITLHSL